MSVVIYGSFPAGNISGIVSPTNGGTGFASQSKYAVLTADAPPINANTSLADIPGLTLALGIGTFIVDFQVTFFSTTDGTPGSKLMPVFTGTGTAGSGRFLRVTGDTTGVTVTPYPNGGTSFLAATQQLASTQSSQYEFNGVLFVTVAGNFKVQAAQFSSQAQNTTAKIGSYLRSFQIA